MDIDRPHFRTTSTVSSTTAITTTSELFICFTSRLSSSSSMKIPKSILSPGHAAQDAGSVSLSSSLSRRLRTSGSLKGGQASPFFNTSGKKRSGGFENAEPSSPKVTCIGQVRVKTKKRVKQSRNLSKRRSSGGGGVSFRKIEQQSRVDGDDKVCGQQQQRYSNPGAHFLGQPQQECLPHRNQRWVHLPISICEALRTFGADLSCLFPCRSFCTSTGEREKNEKQNCNENGCGAVFARWLVSVNDGEGAKREIELVVGGGDEEEEAQTVFTRISRRHLFEDIEVKDDRIEFKGQTLEREEETARVSTCIPPKNALLLMRCKSDPMKMAALANNRFNSDAAAAATFASARNENEDIEEKQDTVDCKDQVSGQEVTVSTDTNDEKEISKEAEDKLESDGDKEDIEEKELGISSEEMVEEKTEEVEIPVLERLQDALVVENGGDGDGDGGEEVESNMSSFEALLHQENAEYYEDCCPIKDEEVEEDAPICHLSPSTESDVEAIQGNETPPLLQESSAAMDTTAADSSTEHKDSILENNEEKSQMAASVHAIIADEVAEEKEAKLDESKQTVELVTSNEEEEKKEKEGPLLPQCLMLMMCEPKLSMEVSKETWVCSTDFIRWFPERPRKAAKSTKPGDHEPMNRRLSMDSKPKPSIGKNELQQPQRSSCSLPAAAAAASMATLIEQKLVNAVGYEPFVLTRCKSEPMRSASAKLIPESCFWKNAVRKLEQQRCATLGASAARVGF